MWDVGVKNESLMGAGFKGVGFRFFPGFSAWGFGVWCPELPLASDRPCVRAAL